MRKKKQVDSSKGTPCIGQMDLSTFMVVPADTPDYVLNQIGREWAARREAEYTYASVMAIQNERNDPEAE